MGLPEKENNYGAAGKQLIYGKHVRSYVYTKGNTVVDWQFLE
jgi:hypothetical protein